MRSQCLSQLFALIKPSQIFALDLLQRHIHRPKRAVEAIDGEVLHIPLRQRLRIVRPPLHTELLIGVVLEDTRLVTPRREIIVSSGVLRLPAGQIPHEVWQDFVSLAPQNAGINIRDDIHLRTAEDKELNLPVFRNILLDYR